MRSLTPALLAVEQVRGHDLEVVVGGVGEGAAAVAVAERPDARHVGRELVVDRDVAARVDRDAGLVEAEIVGVRAGGRPRAARASRRRPARPPAQSTPTATPSLVRRQADALGVGADRDALVRRGSPGSPRRRPRPRGAISRGPARPRSPRRRSGGTSARTRGRCSCRRRRRGARGTRSSASIVRVGEVRRPCRRPGRSGTQGAAADVDEDARRLQQLVADSRRGPGPRSGRGPGRPCSPACLAATSRRRARDVRGDCVGARLDPRHVDPHRGRRGRRR